MFNWEIECLITPIDTLTLDDQSLKFTAPGGGGILPYTQGWEFRAAGGGDTALVPNLI